jgi:hypothetical protein
VPDLIDITSSLPGGCWAAIKVRDWAAEILEYRGAKLLAR